MTSTLVTTGGSGWDDSTQHPVHFSEAELGALAAVCADVSTYLQSDLGTRLERAAHKIDTLLGDLAVKRLKRELTQLPETDADA